MGHRPETINKLSRYSRIILDFHQPQPTIKVEREKNTMSNMTIEFGEMIFTLDRGLLVEDAVGEREELTFVTFTYNNKLRYGLHLGDDARPNTNNITVMTTDGLRTFNKDKVEGMLELMKVKTNSAMDVVHPNFK